MQQLTRCSCINHKDWDKVSLVQCVDNLKLPKTGKITIDTLMVPTCANAEYNQVFSHTVWAECGFKHVIPYQAPLVVQPRTMGASVCPTVRTLNVVACGTGPSTELRMSRAVLKRRLTSGFHSFPRFVGVPSQLLSVS